MILPFSKRLEDAFINISLLDTAFDKFRLQQ